MLWGLNALIQQKDPEQFWNIVNAQLQWALIIATWAQLVLIEYLLIYYRS